MEKSDPIAVQAAVQNLPPIGAVDISKGDSTSASAHSNKGGDDAVGHEQIDRPVTRFNASVAIGAVASVGFLLMLDVSIISTASRVRILG